MSKPAASMDGSSLTDLRPTRTIALGLLFAAIYNMGAILLAEVSLSPYLGGLVGVGVALNAWFYSWETAFVQLIVYLLCWPVVPELSTLPDFSQLPRWHQAALYVLVNVTIVLAATALRRSVRRTREAEQAQRQIVEIATEGIWTLDAGAHTTFANRQLTRMFGYTEQEMLGKSLFYFVDPASERAAREYLRSVALGLTETTDFAFLRKDGSELWAIVSAAPLPDGKTRPGGLLVMVTDITERRTFEQKLLRYAGDLMESRKELEQRHQELAVQARKLEEAWSAADSAARAKSEFLAMMSHEIRTPMNGVIGMTSLLLESPLSPTQEEAVETIRNSGEALLAILNDILDFSKMEAGKLALENAEFEIGVAVEQCVELMTQSARRKGLDLHLVIDSDVPPRLWGDAGRVRQVLLNLLSNAVKFTESGEVGLRVSSRPHEDGLATLRFEVRDTGPGIPEEARLRLFQPFMQATASTARRFGGTGLGLVISKRLTEMLGGEIDYSSKVDGGSTFWFTTRMPVGRLLPGLEEEAAVMRGKHALVVHGGAGSRKGLGAQLTAFGLEVECVAAKADGVSALRRRTDAGQTFDLAIVDDLETARALRATAGGERLPLVLESFAGEPEMTGAAVASDITARLSRPVRPSQLRQVLCHVLRHEAPEPPHAKVHPQDLPFTTRAKVLLAEDNPVSQKVGLHFLERLGCRVDVVTNGIEAVRAVGSATYDLVFMDCEMPEMDGMEATREIRRRYGPTGVSPVVIAMTASALDGDREKCLGAGMDDYLPKPVRLEELEQLVGRWLNHGRA